MIAPILIYAVPVWYNQSASLMEKIRTFERSCLRACLSKFRSAHSNYQHFTTNKILYNASGIPRIDNFAIKLIRNYYASLRKIIDNPIIAELSK